MEVVDENEMHVHFDEFEVLLKMTPLGYEAARDERDGDDPTSARAALIHATGGQLISTDGARELPAGVYVVTGKLFAFGGPPGWRGTIDLG